KSLRGFAKWAAAASEKRPGLMPQKMTSRPGASTSGTADGVGGAGSMPRRSCRFGLAVPEARFEREPDALGEDRGCVEDGRLAGRDDLDGLVGPTRAVAPEVALLFTQRSQPLHGANARRRCGRYRLVTCLSARASSRTRSRWTRRGSRRARA